jgi:hypothetical protein
VLGGADDGRCSAQSAKGSVRLKVMGAASLDARVAASSLAALRAAELRVAALKLAALQSAVLSSAALIVAAWSVAVL